MPEPIPPQYKSAIPYLCCKNASDAIEFYKRAFGAVEMMRIGPPGMVGHAEMRIGDAIFMLADEFPQMDFRSPLSFGGSPVQMYVYVRDVDAFAKKAEAEGCTIVRPPTTQFYGDRSVAIKDPFGHTWGFATHVEDVSPQEIQKRAAQMFGKKQ